MISLTFQIFYPGIRIWSLSNSLSAAFDDFFDILCILWIQFLKLFQINFFLIQSTIPNPIETMDENTKVTLAFDKELLYKNMVDAKADWLYQLPQWDEIFSEEKRKELYKEQKKSGTVVKPHKIGRNDPCPCGSGKKYKYCCGK